MLRIIIYPRKLRTQGVVYGWQIVDLSGAHVRILSPKVRRDTEFLASIAANHLIHQHLVVSTHNSFIFDNFLEFCRELSPRR